jgi:hypothetical protein
VGSSRSARPPCSARRTREGAVTTAAGIERVPRTVGLRDGLPVLEDQRVLDVATHSLGPPWIHEKSGSNLVHQITFGPPRLRRGEEGADAQARGCRQRARAVLRRPGLPVRCIVGVDPRLARDAEFVVKTISSRTTLGADKRLDRARLSDHEDRVVPPPRPRFSSLTGWEETK